MKKKRSIYWLSQLPIYGFLIGYLLFTVVPIYWVFATSFKPSTEVMSFPPTLLPHTLSLENYVAVFTQTHLGRGVVNSLIVSLVTTALALFIAALAAYSFTRFRFRGKYFLLNTVLGLYLIPPLIGIIPLFLLFNKLGLLNNLFGLALAYQSLVLPLLTFMLRNYFEGIPVEIEEAAMIDGCSQLEVLRRITLPLAVPGLATAAIFAFIFSWNEFVIALTLLLREDLKTVQLVIMEFVKLHRIEWGQLTAAMVVGMVPVLIVIIFAQRYLISGLLGGATKS